MLAAFLDYDPDLIDPKYKAQLAEIFKLRSELLLAGSEISALRARAWAGETGLDEEINMREEGIKKIKKSYGTKLTAIVKDSVDVAGLAAMLPRVGMSVLQKFKVPPLLLLEALGVNPKDIKEGLKVLKEDFSQ